MTAGSDRPIELCPVQRTNMREHCGHVATVIPILIPGPESWQSSEAQCTLYWPVTNNVRGAYHTPEGHHPTHKV